MINNKDNNLLILLGPTGVGKTDISIKLAQKIPDVEIISADSMQIYEYMDIGTAKPDKSILNTIKHHMIDIVDPAENFDVIQYNKLAANIILDVFKRGKIPILAGGSGLYISSLINPLFTGPAKDIEYRETLEEEATVHGKKYLHEKLSKIDSVSASKIKPNDLRRIIRALEVYKSTGKTISYLQKKASTKNAPFKYYIIGFKRDKENIYQRINLRVDKMIKDGFIEEVKMLREMGYKEDLISMQGLGYKQINKHINGVCTKEEAIDLIKIETRHYAKRQMTWFKNKIENIEWIDLEEYDEDEVILRIENKINKAR
ncbi:tRNA (adenosine(37)-N6)-dimethylallyltransferase MiaA [bacterium]|nr:tRNA (adenosine(37)-N6)-dimethylallyltransferase MiaA [bacterium]MBU4362405.1 tRNA (adenosine(37)-N6)-dimethylallyltransferase MiaA [bacterium]